MIVSLSMERMVKKVKNAAWLWLPGLFMALCLFVFLPETAEAAEKKTIYNSPYVTFSPDGQAWTTNAGEQDYIWYRKGTIVPTGVSSSLRSLQEGEHYYQRERWGEVPIGYWRVNYRTGSCIHDAYPVSGEDYHGIPFGRSKCMRYYYSGWHAYCADCGELIQDMYIYMSKEAAASIDYLDLGSAENRISYYYLCPFCRNLEQGAELQPHSCQAVSWNQYKVIYDPNVGASDQAGGYMEASLHMYNNATEYEGESVIPATHLSRNAYWRTGYVFTGWNTKPDGSGTAYAEEAEIFNLTDKDWRVGTSEEGSITLYAQWRSCESTLVIDANGGTYDGSAVLYKTDLYGEKYLLQNDLLQAPDGFTIVFETNGGEMISPVTGTQHFREWSMGQPFKGSIRKETYYFTAPDGNVDTITACYDRDAVSLPAAVKQGSSFGGWYYDPGFTLPAGGAGDQLIPCSNMTLYAQWVELRLTAEDNYSVNGGKGAVDLSWQQPDGRNKSYLLYQSLNKQTWKKINSAGDISNDTKVYSVYTYTGNSGRYTVPYTGLYTLSAQGAQGGSYGNHTGGYGGGVTATFWLEKGEVITYTVGGQNGYNGGGAANAYAGGGGMTTVSSNRKGVLLIAGGGGGATDLNDGLPGGSVNSKRADKVQAGENGASGGGGGYVGGTAGK